MRRLVLTLLLIGCFFLTPTVLAQGIPEKSSNRGWPNLQKIKKAKKPPSAAARALRASVDRIEWEDVTLEEIAEWLREQGKVNVVVHWRRLEDAGIDRDSAVSLRLQKVSVAAVLAQALEQLSDVEPLRFQGEGNIITISTKQFFSSKMYVRVYEIHDLLMRIPDFTDAPRVSVTEQGGGGGGGSGGGGDTDPIFEDDDSDDDDDAEWKQDQISRLMLLITETIEPDSWYVNHTGGEGTIRVFNDMLVVRNSLEVHEKIGGPFYLVE